MTCARVHENENRKMDMRHVDGNWRVVRRGGALVGRGHSAGAVVVYPSDDAEDEALGEKEDINIEEAILDDEVSWPLDGSKTRVTSEEAKKNAKAVEERRGEEDETGKQAEEPGSREGTRDSTETRKRDEEAGREFASGEEEEEAIGVTANAVENALNPSEIACRHRESFV